MNFPHYLRLNNSDTTNLFIYFFETFAISFSQKHELNHNTGCVNSRIPLLGGQIIRRTCVLDTHSSVYNNLATNCIHPRDTLYKIMKCWKKSPTSGNTVNPRRIEDVYPVREERPLYVHREPQSCGRNLIRKSNLRRLAKSRRWLCILLEWTRDSFGRFIGQRPVKERGMNRKVVCYVYTTSLAQPWPLYRLSSRRCWDYTREPSGQKGDALAHW